MAGESTVTNYEFIWPRSENEGTSKYDQKYIIALVDNKDLHFVTLVEPYHSDITVVYRMKLENEQGRKLTKVLGGGIVTIDPVARTVFTYGSSGGFGPPEISTVRKCLEETAAKQGYQCTVTITDYIRG